MRIFKTEKELGENKIFLKDRFDDIERLTNKSGIKAVYETKTNSLHIVSHSGRHTATCRARIMIIQTEVPPGLIDELIDGHMKWEAQDGRMRKRYTGHLDLKYRLCVTLWM